MREALFRMRKNIKVPAPLESHLKAAESNRSRRRSSYMGSVKTHEFTIFKEKL